MEINCTYAKNDIRIIMAWTTGHCVLLRHLVIMKIKEHNMCRMCGEGQETPLHILHDCPATLGHRVAWEALMTNPEHDPQHDRETALLRKGTQDCEARDQGK